MKQPTRKQLQQQIDWLQDRLDHTVSRRDCYTILEAIYEARRKNNMNELTTVMHYLEGVLG